MATQAMATGNLGTVKQSPDRGYPYTSSPVFRTSTGTPYLRRPGVAVKAAPSTDLSGLYEFLAGFDSELKFAQYLDDPVELSDGAQLVKSAGQSCYASFGPKRSTNERAARYINNILESGHGSVLEHANYTIFVYGVSRSLTHEFVRHRAGFAFSQLSQRYVSGKVLRFVERPEYVEDTWLHERFERRIDFLAQEYADITERLLQRQEAGSGLLSAEAKTDRRKRVQQAARSALPNEAETFLDITANIRAWRHVINMRANEHAEIEIRALAVAIYQLLSSMEPLLFADMELVQHTDGTYVVNVQHPKV